MSYSEWKERDRKHKEFRQSHDGPEVPRGVKTISADKRRKKPKKSNRWCNGVEGREHTVFLKGYWDGGLAQCSGCGLQEYALPVEALAQVYKRAKMYVDYHELCKEYGHIWEDEIVFTWWKKKVKSCAICGKTTDWWQWATPLTDQTRYGMMNL